MMTDQEKREIYLHPQHDRLYWCWKGECRAKFESYAAFRDHTYSHADIQKTTFNRELAEKAIDDAWERDR